MSVKYIFVTGGVVSGLGKGIAAASLGRLLKQRGLRVKVQKLDPYLNVDPGTMNPYQHGEVFVTGDGAETDLDLGHYERFIDEDLDVNSSVSSGKVYWDVLDRERLFSQSLEALERQLLERLCTGSEAEEATVLEELSSIRRAGACSETFGMLLFFFVPGKSLADSILKNMTSSHAVWSGEGKLAVLLHGCVDPGEGGRKILNFLFRLTGQSYSGVYLTKRYLKTQIK